MSKDRNLGIDLLRILSMFFVVIIHFIGHGGMQNSTEWSRQFLVSRAIFTWTFCAVDIFALISGYVGYTEIPKQHNYANYLVMWLQVVFYGVLVTTVFCIFRPELVTKEDFAKVISPVRYGLYWYFDAYTGLFFVIPLLNSAIRKCSEIYLKRMFIVIIFLFSALGIFHDTFSLLGGYTFAWLVILYVLGAIIKKCRIGSKMNPLLAVVGIIVLCMGSLYIRLYGPRITIFGITVYKESFEEYTSPNVLLTAILYIVAFSKLEIKSLWIKKLLSFATPGVFAIYLLNTQDKVWTYVIPNSLSYLSNKGIYTLVSHLGLASICFVLLALVVDYFRQKLFRAMRIQEVAEWIVRQCEKVLNYCIQIL